MTAETARENWHLSALFLLCEALRGIGACSCHLPSHHARL
jgi:hypothetical protein